MNEKVLLIHTDGYDIDVSEYISIDNARKTMIEAYDDLKPSELDTEWAEMSYCDDNDAKLYRNGEDVHIWKLHIVS